MPDKPSDEALRATEGLEEWLPNNYLHLFPECGMKIAAALDAHAAAELERAALKIAAEASKSHPGQVQDVLYVWVDRLRARAAALRGGKDG